MKKLFIVYLLLVMVLKAEVTTVQDLLKDAKKNVRSLDTKEIIKILKQNPNTQIIDVRLKSEILEDGGFIKGNRVTNISRDKIEFLIANEVNEKETFIVHCSDGRRSLLVAKKLKDMGYKNVIHYKDSFNGWKRAGLKSSSLDKYRGSMLYSSLEKVADGVYASIGQTAPPSFENSGHNNNLGVVIGEESVLVWNAGGNYLLAKAFHEEIKKITDKPIKYVVLENSQSHAMLGSSYWKSLGAKIVSHAIAKEEIIQKGERIIQRSKRRLEEKILGSEIVLPDITFKEKIELDLGKRKVQAQYYGYAHEQSDIVLWLPKEKIVFAGDHAFHQRLLPIFEHTDIDKWLIAWEKFASLNAQIVIPGHGDVTDMSTVTKYTKDYLVYIKEEVAKILEDDGELVDAYNIDMSAYEHLDTFRELGKQNISRVFKKMEFE